MRIDPILEIYVDYNNIDNCLLQKYIDQIEIHNNSDNSGFDIFFPEETTFESIDSKMVKFNIKCVMRNFYGGSAVGYYLYPRSSISKTSLRMSNSLGIIDSGYRGEITAVVDIVNHFFCGSIKLNAMERYFQLCHPSLMPFRVVMVDNIEELGITARGDGGFGSTGK